jgi:putative membrane protein
MLLLALLHPIVALNWWRWSIHPSTAIGIAALGALYLWAAQHLRRRPTVAQGVSFFSGLLVMFASLNGPIHDLSDVYLFSAHMVQHLLLTLAMPPLLLAGVPGWMLRPLVSRPGIAPAARFSPAHRSHSSPSTSSSLPGIFLCSTTPRWRITTSTS